MTLGVSLLNKITTVKNNCQQLFILFNINLIINFQIDRLINQFDLINPVKLKIKQIVRGEYF